MTAIPHNLSSFKTTDFADYLAREGAKVLAPTNQYEVIRYQTMETVQRGETQITKQQTHIVYRKATGQLTYTGWSNKHYKDFMRGWSLGAIAPNLPRRPKKKRRPPSTGADRKAILARDGNECWFCGQYMPEDDRTLEHLLPKSLGGGNGKANLCLAHRSCNQMAANKSITEKIALRSELRRLSESGDYEP